ncbi:Zinc finger protein [Porphyridium purpureum]|uniref:Zinc finger protein n=1 Tax=Porphyridium purpureum TaxID=35688 RepID=A0A5J4Z7P4_PORPP|nr:Zinc finger protein [Porphyridium purpureum]|eukprot:POR4062..scf295_1
MEVALFEMDRLKVERASLAGLAMMGAKPFSHAQRTLPVHAAASTSTTSRSSPKMTRTLKRSRSPSDGTKESAIVKPVKATPTRVKRTPCGGAPGHKLQAPAQEEQSKAMIAAQVLGLLRSSSQDGARTQTDVALATAKAASAAVADQRPAEESLYVPPQPHVSIMSPTSACSHDGAAMVANLVISPSVRMQQEQACKSGAASCMSYAESLTNVETSTGNDVEVPCDQCHRRFRRTSNLAKHVRMVHQAERDYRCLQCPASFTQPNSLKKHVSCVHEKVRRHVCDECGNAFGQSGDLNVHIKTVHNRERAFPCLQCDQRFKMRQHLDKHVRMKHEKLRPFACPCCGRRFSEKTDAKRHVLHVHPTETEIVSRIDTLLQPSMMNP